MPAQEVKLPHKHVDVLIIGGGPAGSYAATTLSQEGLDVAVLEASKFPRYHIGESLIPSVRHYLRFIGAEEKLANHGFVRKPGAALKFRQYTEEGYTDFVAIGHNNNAWNVDRSEFDLLLLNHARACGASVYELTRVNSLTFSQTDPSRPISATWTHTGPPIPISPPASPKASSEGTKSPEIVSEPVKSTGATSFKYLVDASGRAGVMSTKYLKNRHFNLSLKNIAVWAYWKDVATYGVGTKREGSPWFEALTDESGWAWFIPLHNGTTSVGVVMNQDVYNQKLKHPTPSSPLSSASAPNHSNSDSATRYLTSLSLAPHLVDLIGSNGTLMEGTIAKASDYSYSAPSYAGHGFRIVGDAGAFIDPLFSSGIHLAMTSALSAAATICASFREDISETEAAQWHTNRVATSYTRFQLVVLSAYKQIRAQSMSILSDVDENNFNRAFAFLRPVIQGASDVGTRLSEAELQKSLDFCVSLFNPTTPEQHEKLHGSGKISKELLDVTSPVMHPSLFEKALLQATPSVEKENEVDLPTSKLVLDKINARRIVHAEYGIHNLESETLDGHVVRLKKGSLGLEKV
ncbi:FAD binding domain-containing protein [Guyanagaster necrorhizus]|uniref:FAD binding domain-containing protein n=1 Tax=Guyanagaster necrorhizus TaxID=856835 RepID=A0A9P7VYP0_9AGAR|nr:FAD binding domain-containing protein [Guyanagaster necrorhizus MCA 3950]KAG7449623.1 FAD binding domain-containing protein [Guyanagaster necrorhizus MCA 3950]